MTAIPTVEKHGISGSRVAAVLGLSPYKSPVEIWAELCEERRPGFGVERGIAVPPPPDNAAIRWGLAFEDAVIDLAEREHGDRIGQREHLLTMTGPAGCECSAHVDGVYQDTADFLHEGKTTAVYSFNDRWGEPGSDKIPAEYQAQVQHQMACARAYGWKTDRVIVSVLCWPKRVEDFEEMGLDASKVDASQWAHMLATLGYFHQFEVAADLELQAVMLERCDLFWNRYVLPETAPPAKSMNDLKVLFPAPKGTAVADARVARMAAEYVQINGELALMTKRKKELAAAIIAAVKPNAPHPIDKDSRQKLIIRDATGAKLGSFDGKTWRAGRKS